VPVVKHGFTGVRIGSSSRSDMALTAAVGFNATTPSDAALLRGA